MACLGPPGVWTIASGRSATTCRLVTSKAGPIRVALAAGLKPETGKTACRTRQTGAGWGQSATASGLSGAPAAFGAASKESVTARSRPSRSRAISSGARGSRMTAKAAMASRGVRTRRAPIFSTLSPGRMPAAAAGPPAPTARTTGAATTVSRSRPAASSLQPGEGYTTLPSASSASTTRMSSSVETAKLMPMSVSPADAKIADIMPTRRPRRSTSAPPELPGLAAASVWTKSSTALKPASVTFSAETTPHVTERPRP